MIESQVLAQALRYIAKYGGAKVQPVEYLEMDYDTFYSYDYYGGGESDYADHLVDPPNGDNTEAVVKGQGKVPIQVKKHSTSMHHTAQFCVPCTVRLRLSKPLF